jgi:hypothetical protein
VWAEQSTLSSEDSGVEVIESNDWPEAIEFTKIYKIGEKYYKALFSEGQYVDVVFDIDPVTEILNRNDVKSTLQEYTTYAAEKQEAESRYTVL